MARINIELPEDLHQSIRVDAVNKRKSVKDTVVYLLQLALDSNRKSDKVKEYKSGERMAMTKQDKIILNEMFETIVEQNTIFYISLSDVLTGNELASDLVKKATRIDNKIRKLQKSISDWIEQDG